MTQVEKAPAQAPAGLLDEPDRLYGSEEFFREQYRPLLRVAVYMGALPQEAEDAVMATMLDVLERWREIEQPLAYAKRAVPHNFLKTRERSLDRLRDRQVARRDGPRDSEDLALTVWEDQQWVDQLLDTLPPAQREVIDGVLAELSTAEISLLLGKTRDAVRQNLHAARQRLKAALDREQADEHGGHQTSSSRKESR